VREIIEIIFIYGVIYGIVGVLGIEVIIGIIWYLIKKKKGKVE